MYKKYIVCTTINSPTEAVKKFDNLEGWNLIVVGDRKTPNDYVLENGIYLTPEMQESISKELSDLIGWNCIQRRNFGFVEALSRGADLIATVDDDNIPYANWGEQLLLGDKVEVSLYESNQVAFDPVGATNYPKLWHRGFPLQLLSNRNYGNKSTFFEEFQVQANFWNGDPDIDAIARMEHAPECNFEESVFPFASNKIAPFNSQNTILSKQVIHDYFLFPGVGRMDDIWASFYVQARGHKVVFDRPTVYQLRNQHDLTKDMKGELIGYEYNLRIIESLIHDPESIRSFLPEKTIQAWDVYRNLIS
jgi:hypothetical protein